MKINLGCLAESILSEVRALRKDLRDDNPDASENELDGAAIAALVLAVESAYFTKYPDIGPDALVDAVALCRVGRGVACAINAPNYKKMFPTL